MHMTCACTCACACACDMCMHTQRYIRTGLMRVGHAVLAQQLQRGAREAAAVEGERARLDLLVQAVHRLVERVLGVGSEVREWGREGGTSQGVGE